MARSSHVTYLPVLATLQIPLHLVVEATDLTGSPPSNCLLLFKIPRQFSDPHIVLCPGMGVAHYGGGLHLETWRQMELSLPGLAGNCPSLCFPTVTPQAICLLF